MDSERVPDTSCEDLFLRYLERAETEGSAVLEELCSEHPEHAAELRSRAEALARIGLGSLPNESAHALPERFGPFRLIEPIGEGGMGIVYLAEDEQLGRQVALKIVRPEQLAFSGARERFQREVTSIARLQHPGIVPVYSVGEQAGIPYFVMERIAGRTLGEVIERLEGRDPARLTGTDLAAACHIEDSGEPPSKLFDGSWGEVVTRVMREASEALEHAHRRQILHRDIKPSNIMITPTGRVLLVDFGLSSNDAVDHMTRTGAQLGSLPYMPPESFSGGARALDERSDVYSMGVSLYELATLRRPFGGSSELDLRASITTASPEPLRQLTPNASWELETICHAALDRDPARRYASAGALAADLGRALAGEPILAKRPTAWRRARQWIARHPVMALGIAVTTIGPLLFALEAARSARRIDSERARADERLGTALSAGELLRESDKRLRNKPHMDPERVVNLRAALAVHESLAESEDSTAVWRGLRDAHHDLGRLLFTLGRVDESEEHHAAAARVTERLLERSPGDVYTRAKLATSLDALARVAGARGQLEEKERLQRRSLELLTEIPNEAGAREFAITELGTRLYGRVEFLWQQGRYEEGLQVAEAGAEALQAVLERDVENEESYQARFALANLLFSEALIHLSLDEPDAFAATMNAAYTHARKTSAARPDSRSAQYLEARVSTGYGKAMLDAGETEQALELFREQAARARERVERYPEDVKQHESLLVSSNFVGLILSRAREPEEDIEVFEQRLAEAEEVYRERLQQADAATALFPDLERMQYLLCSGGSALADVLRRRDQLEEAVGLAELFTPLAREIYERAPRDPERIELWKAMQYQNIQLAVRMEDPEQTVLHVRTLLTDLPQDGWAARVAAMELGDAAAMVRVADRSQTALVLAEIEREALAELARALQAGAATPEEVRHGRNWDTVRELPGLEGVLAE